MTIEELDKEDLTLLEVVRDLELLVKSYHSWLAKNEVLRAVMLERMRRETKGAPVGCGL